MRLIWRSRFASVCVAAVNSVVCARSCCRSAAVFACSSASAFSVAASFASVAAVALRRRSAWFAASMKLPCSRGAYSPALRPQKYRSHGFVVEWNANEVNTSWTLRTAQMSLASRFL